MVGGRKAEGGRKEGREGRGRERGEGGVQNKTNQGERKLKESSCWERQSSQQAGRQAGDETNTRRFGHFTKFRGGRGKEKVLPPSLHSARLWREKNQTSAPHIGVVSGNRQQLMKNKYFDLVFYIYIYR